MFNSEFSFKQVEASENPLHLHQGHQTLLSKASYNTWQDTTYTWHFNSFLAVDHQNTYKSRCKCSHEALVTRSVQPHQEVGPNLKQVSLPNTHMLFSLRPRGRIWTSIVQWFCKNNLWYQSGHHSNARCKWNVLLSFSNIPLLCD